MLIVRPQIVPDDTEAATLLKRATAAIAGPRRRNSVGDAPAPALVEAV